MVYGLEKTLKHLVFLLLGAYSAAFEGILFSLMSGVSETGYHISESSITTEIEELMEGSIPLVCY